MYLFIKIFFKRHILLPMLSIAMLISAMLGITNQALQASVNQTECYELLTNGNFNSLDSWSFGKTNYISSIINQDNYEGQRSLQVGIAEGISNRLAHSTAYQRISLPKNIRSATVSYWKRPGGNADGVDYREMLILSDDFVTVAATVERDFSEGSNQWIEVTQDLTEPLQARAGQEAVLYINVYNNGTGSQMWQQLDAISLMVCIDISAEPTATPITPHQQVMPTGTPEVSVDAPTDESITKIQLGSDITALGSEIETLIPINILDIPDGYGVSETTIELVYDWSSLKVTGCKEESEGRISQLLCNFDEPGIIRISAKSAQGLIGDNLLTEIKFVSLSQPIHRESARTQPLDVAIVFFNDLSGSSIDVMTESGEITLLCLRGDVNCDNKSDGIDSLSILQYAVKMRASSRIYPLDVQQQIFLPACDVNGNSNCDAIDSLFISQCDVGFSNLFCPESGDDLARNLQSVPNQISDGNIIRVAEVPAGATDMITVPVTAELVGSSLSAATMDLIYDPAILKVVDCIKNPENNFDQVVCNSKLDANGIGLDEIGFVATSFEGTTGDLTIVTIVFEVLSEIDETTAAELFRLRARTFANSNGQRLGYTVEGVGPNLIYLPMIQR